MSAVVVEHAAVDRDNATPTWAGWIEPADQQQHDYGEVPNSARYVSDPVHASCDAWNAEPVDLRWSTAMARLASPSWELLLT